MRRVCVECGRVASCVEGIRAAEICSAEGNAGGIADSDVEGRRRREDPVVRGRVGESVSIKRISDTSGHAVGYTPSTSRLLLPSHFLSGVRVASCCFAAQLQVQCATQRALVVRIFLASCHRVAPLELDSRCEVGRALRRGGGHIMGRSCLSQQRRERDCPARQECVVNLYSHYRRQQRRRMHGSMCG